MSNVSTTKSREVLEKRYYDAIAFFEESKISQDNLTSFSDEELKDFWKRANDTVIFYNVLQTVVKVNANGCYGAMGSDFFPYTDLRIAADITAECRGGTHALDDETDNFFGNVWHTMTDYHQKLREKFPNVKFADVFAPIHVSDDDRMCIYADTDSLFINFGKVIKSMGIDTEITETKVVSDIIAYIMAGPVNDAHDKCLTKYAHARNCENNHIFEHEVTSRKGIFLAKKKYVCSKIWQDGSYIGNQQHLKATGIELAQRAYSSFVKDVIKHFVNYMLSPVQYSEEHYFKMGYAAKEALRSRPLEDLALGKRVKFAQNAERNPVTGLYQYRVKKLSKNNEVISKAGRPCPEMTGAINYNNLVIRSELTMKYPLIVADGQTRVKFYSTKEGGFFAWPYDIDCPVDIAPKPDLDDMAERTIFGPVKRILACVLPASDLTKLGSSLIRKSRRNIYE